VFISSKEALKEDSEEEGSSSGADDELDADEEEEPDDRVKAQNSSDGHEQVRTTSTDDTYIYRRSPTPKAVEESAPPSAATPPIDLPSAKSEGTGSAAEAFSIGTDSAQSIPPSPQVSGDSHGSSRFSQMSESEMSASGTETRSIMKTLSSLWTYRAIEWAALEYP